MTMRFMPMLTMSDSTDAGNISLVPPGLRFDPGGARDPVSVQRIGIPGRKVGTLPALYADCGLPQTPCPAVPSAVYCCGNPVAL
jgi:hypothetical protein